jgi:hypothetical protein
MGNIYDEKFRLTGYTCISRDYCRKPKQNQSRCAGVTCMLQECYERKSGMLIVAHIVAKERIKWRALLAEETLERILDGQFKDQPSRR